MRARPTVRESLWAGLVGGGALGVFEALLVVLLAEHDPSRLYDRVLIPLAPVVVYGVGGAIVCALLRRRGRIGLIIGLVAALAPLRVHASEALARRWFAPLVAAALALAFLACLRAFVPRRVGARIAPFAWLGACALPLAAWLAAGWLDAPAARPAAAHRDPSAPESPNVCLVTWDTVRADTLPAFGGAGLDTPELDRLLREGVLFDRFQAVASSTAPAHTSMLTGLYPIRHGLRSNGEAAPPLELPRLSELFAAAGYATGGFVSTYVLRRDFGFDRGFDAFEDDGDDRPIARVLARFSVGCALVKFLAPADLVFGAVNAPGERTLARALAWYRAVDRPAFMWVHFYDAHHPYRPHEPFRARALARRAEGPHAVDPAVEDGLVLQRAEIEELDQLLGDLRRGLEERDPGLARTWIVLAADHGECFGEGGIRQGHHKSLFRATQHVVGAIRPAGSATDLPRGVRVDAPASQVDLYPTICAFSGRTPPDGLQGIDLTPSMRGMMLPARGLYMETFQASLGQARMYGWWEDGWKYVRRLDGREALFEDGAQGEIDRTHDAGSRMAALRARLDEFLRVTPHAVESGRALTDEGAFALKKLGYAGDE